MVQWLQILWVVSRIALRNEKNEDSIIRTHGSMSDQHDMFIVTGAFTPSL